MFINSNIWKLSDVVVFDILLRQEFQQSLCWQGKYAHMWHQTEDYSLAVGVFLANSRFLLRTKSSSKALHSVANKSLLHIEAQFMT